MKINDKSTVSLFKEQLDVMQRIRYEYKITIIGQMKLAIEWLDKKYPKK